MNRVPRFMAFAPKPSETRNSINRAGKKLVNITDFPVHELHDAVGLISRWRACHAYPINTFQSTLRTKLKAHNYKNYLVAQRLKRLPTIVDKLKRFPTMNLTQMQDIGGVRAILSKVSDVYKLRSEYVSNGHFKEMLDSEKDYISEPRDDDGYRSLHLIFTYKNKGNPSYDGLKLEMQIRTKLQHAWATAVETMGTFTGQALKSRQGDETWLDFFASASSAFSHIEKSPPVPKFSHLNRAETFKMVAYKEKNLGFLEKMSGFSIAADAIYTEKGRGTSYWLITLDSENKSVGVEPFASDRLDVALISYSQKESEALNGRKIEPVLVSSKSIESLKAAYPNFFLDTSEFRNTLERIVEEAKK